MPISARGILATIAASAGQNGHFSKVGTVYVYLLSNFQFYNNLLKVVICKIFTQRTRSLDSGSLYKGSNAREKRENKGSCYMEGVAKTSLTVCGRDFNIFLPIFILLITVYEFQYGEMHLHFIAFPTYSTNPIQHFSSLPTLLYL